MSKFVERLRDILLQGSNRARSCIIHRRAIVRSNNRDDNSFIVLSMSEVKEIVNMFKELDEKSNNLVWRLKSDAEQ